METSKLSVPEDVLEKIKGYCLEAGQPVENWAATAWRFLEKNGIDIYHETYEPTPVDFSDVEEERTELLQLCGLMRDFLKKQKQRQTHLPDPEVLQKATDRIAEQENLIRMYQDKLDEYSDERSKLIIERMNWQNKFYDRDKQNYYILEQFQKQEKQLKKQEELLEKAKAELKRCKGFFATANNEVLEELGV